MPLELGDKRITPVAKADSTDECPRGVLKCWGEGEGEDNGSLPIRGLIRAHH